MKIRKHNAARLRFDLYTQGVLHKNISKSIILLLCFCCSFGYAQNIPNINFAQAIRAQCPTCIDGSNNLMAVAATRTSLNVSNRSISNLTGIEGFTSLQFLDCSYNQLTSLPDLPSTLQVLACHSNQLTSLPTLPSSLQLLNCGINQLTSLPNLPSFLQRLSCEGNQLTSLPALPNTLQELYCQNNQLTSLPNLPGSLRYLSCSNNQLTSLPNLPSSLLGLGCSNNQLKSLPALPSSLQDLGCGINQLTSLLALPSSLQRLTCDGNQLTSLPTLPNSLQILDCRDNQLTSLPALPSSLQRLTCLNNQLTSLPNLPSSLQALRCDGNQLKSLPALPSTLQELYCFNNQLISLPALPGSLQILYCYNNPLTCLPTLPGSLRVLLIDPDKITCLPNAVANLLVRNASFQLIPTPPVCTPQLIKTGELSDCYATLDDAKKAALNLTSVNTCLGAVTKTVTVSGSCPYILKVTATYGNGNSLSVDFTLKDVAAKGGKVVWQNNMTSTSRTICPNKTVTMALKNHFGRIVTWQKTDASSPVWSDIPGTAGLTELNVTYVSKTTYYRCLICSSCGVCGPPNYTAYSASFKLSPSSICPTNDPTAVVVSNSLLISKAYPTPAHDKVSVQIEAATEGAARFEVMDITGRMVKTFNQTLTEGYNEVTFDIQNLATGLHFIKIKDSANREALVKMSKM